MYFIIFACPITATMRSLYIYLIILCFLAAPLPLAAQDAATILKGRIENYLSTYQSPDIRIEKLSVDSIRTDVRQKAMRIYLNTTFAYQPFRRVTVAGIYQDILQLVPDELSGYSMTLYADRYRLEDLIPNYFLAEKDRSRLFGSKLDYKGKPWTVNVSRRYRAEQGLEGRHIALWQSHGKYYLARQKRWAWQRPRMYCTSEDIFTQSFVVPYIIPMLQNAGAVVFTPRERDTQRNEVIVDNDGILTGLSGGSQYVETESSQSSWMTAEGSGFAHRKRIYRQGDNPFHDGTARYAFTEKKPTGAKAQWIPEIPETGEYAVYVSYKTTARSIDDARYTVRHAGGTTEFRVNQQMGGGTWVYLGTFRFLKGKDANAAMVELTNQSDNDGGVVSADAVRFGGGMGNIERGGSTSSLPRYLEGARYWAQLAGMSDTIYSHSNNDYNDDLNTRSRMVNFLSGGSMFNPQEQGLGIPFETVFSVHSNAGFNMQDSIFGTLGIYTTDNNDGLLAAGTDRLTSRDLTDLVQTQIVSDIERTYHGYWTRRSMWNRNYNETRLPEVPSTIIETLSHQNFTDMTFGHDPNFKFLLSRSIYKAILRYVCTQHGRSFTVQPLPVEDFGIGFASDGTDAISLSWHGVNDPLEASATPQSYIVYTRIGDGGFDNGTPVRGEHYSIDIEPGVIYSFRVTAVNQGGQSMPSEILSAYRSPDERARVLVVNAFDRLSGPAIVNTPDSIGFDLDADPGVPYIYSVSVGGRQTNFRRTQRGDSRGASGSEYEGLQVAGNTFDFPYLHGTAIAAAGGYSFTSCSRSALEKGRISPERYQALDIIMGLQRQDSAMHAAGSRTYRLFTPELRTVLRAYSEMGGGIFVSGAYMGRSLDGGADTSFARDVLKYSHGIEHPSHGSTVHAEGMSRTVSFTGALNTERYAVVSSDVLMPENTQAFTSMVYSDTRQSAAVAYQGTDYRSFVMGFPFEVIDSSDERMRIMRAVLRFITER